MENKKEKLEKILHGNIDNMVHCGEFALASQNVRCIQGTKLLIPFFTFGASLSLIHIPSATVKQVDYFDYELGPVPFETFKDLGIKKVKEGTLLVKWGYYQFDYSKNNLDRFKNPHYVSCQSGYKLIESSQEDEEFNFEYIPGTNPRYS
ncbi:MAG: hypothetical protein ACOYT4_02755 [Nanoarchaeota archaeon]